MAARIRAYDWASTSLGQLERWPNALRSAVDIMLAMPSPATILWGPQQVQLYNDAYIAIARDRHPLLLGRPVAEGWPDAFTKVIAPLLEAARQGRSTQLTAFPVPLTGPEGPEERVFDTDWVPIRDEFGMVAGVLQTLSEATERLKAEKAMRESEARHGLLIGSWAQAVWETDGHGVVVADSPSWRAYTGQTLQEWLGHGWLDAIHPDDRSYAERQWREATEAHGLVNAEFRLRDPSGGWRWTNVRATPVLDAHGAIEKWAGMNIDIHARKHAEAALRTSESRLRATFDAMDQGFMEVEVIMSPEGHASDWRYVTVNPSFHRLTGMEDVTGRLASEVFPDREPEWAERYAQVVTTGEPMRFELPAGAIGRWYDINLINIGGAGSRRIAVVYDDVTERHWAEAIMNENAARQAFLLKLSDALRDEPNPIAIADRAVRMLFDEMGLDRCYIGVYRLREDVGELGPQVHIEGLPPLPAHVRLSDFPKALEIASGKTLVFNDVRHMEDLTEADRANLKDLGHGAILTATLRKGPNNPLWAIVAGSMAPRDWSQNEVLLVEEVTERTWAAIQRSRAQMALGESEDQQRVLIAELQHRTFNLMSMVTSMADATIRSSGSLGDFKVMFHERLAALARVQRLLSRLGENDRVTFDELLRGELDAVGAFQQVDSYVTVDGPKGVELPSSTVQVFAMALHELTTNAVKYGALKQPGARLDVRWRVETDHDGQPWLHVKWIEAGVLMPTSDARPSGTGQGRRLIERALPYQLSASTSYALGSDGVRCAISVPVSAGSGSEDHG